MSKKFIVGFLLFAFIRFFAPDFIPGIVDDIALIAASSLVAIIGTAINKLTESKQEHKIQRMEG